MARSVLLLLTGDFARHTAAAVTAAARAADCLQVAGCTAMGVFNETDWVLDRPAACAMVFANGVSLLPPSGGSAPALSFAVPQAASSDWLASVAPRFGLLSTAGAGQQPGRVWCHGKVLTEGRCEAMLAGTRAGIGVSRGVRLLGDPAPVTGTSGYDLLRLGPHPALNCLLRALPMELREEGNLPLHQLFAGVLEDADDAQALEQGRYWLVPVLAANPDERALTLGAPLQPGARIVWAIRQPVAAECDSRLALERAEAQLGNRPDFAIVFSCLGRGPYFYGGTDRDVDLLRTRHPGLPIAGAYGAGEIAPLPGGNRSIHNSAVFALFHIDVQP